MASQVDHIRHVLDTLLPYVLASTDESVYEENAEAITIRAGSCSVHSEWSMHRLHS